jgi:hypothetical protein
MERNRIKTLQSRTSSCKQFHPATNCYNTLSFQYQLCDKQRYMEDTSPPKYPYNICTAAAEPLWQPTIHTYSTGVPTTTTKYFYTKPIQPLHATPTQHKQRKPLWYNMPQKPSLNTNSRRKVQRRHKRLLKKGLLKAHNQHRLLQSIHHISTRCRTNYGYCSNPSQSLQKKL